MPDHTNFEHSFSKISRREFSKFLSAGLLLSCAGIPQAFGNPLGFTSKRIALVIGNANYKNNPLDNPTNDSEAIAEQLKGFGFDVALLNNGSRSEMIESTREFGQQLKKNDATGLFYYAGHAVQFEWKNYLIPIDAKVSQANDIPATCFDLSELFTALSGAKNPMNLIFLDSCRDNPFGSKIRTTGRGLSQFDAPQGCLLAYATAPGNVASDGNSAHGLYTEMLLQEMRSKDSKIEDVLKRVRLRVRMESQGKQVPWETTSLETDFSFNPVDKASSANAGQLIRLNEDKKALLPAKPIAVATSMPTPAATQIAAPLLTPNALPDKTPSLENQLNQEQAAWEAIEISEDYKKFEAFLYKYPSSQYYQIAQAKLDQLLAQRGQKEIRIINDTFNPYTKGSVTGLKPFSIGDRFSIEVRDPFNSMVQSKYSRLVTGIASQAIELNNGKFWLNILGNPTNAIGKTDGYSQLLPYEYQIGNSWMSTYFNQRGNLATAELHISGRKKVKTPLGEFNAFVIEGHGTNPNSKTRISYEILIDPEKCSFPLSKKFITHSQWNNIVQADEHVLVAFVQS